MKEVEWKEKKGSRRIIKLYMIQTK
jgi:hypothetical protein